MNLGRADPIGGWGKEFFSSFPVLSNPPLDYCRTSKTKFWSFVTIVALSSTGTTNLWNNCFLNSFGTSTLSLLFMLISIYIPLWTHNFQLLFFCLFVCLLLFRAAPATCGSSQARGQIRAVAASLHHSHSNTAMVVCDLHHSSRQCWIPDPLSKAGDGTRILMDTSYARFH